ncbi:MAG: response regulator transcription factor [Lachnospiraceae bacterium]|nr:response regulator transcription factor [Lachnospiraceae bacterium]
MIQIAVCDDEPLLLEEIEKETRQCLEEQKVFSVISAFSTGENLLYEIEEGSAFDLLLLDIELPGISGMELAGRIHKLLPYALILFVTAHYKYAVDAYELNIFRYIPKNQLKERLPHAVRDAVSILEIQNVDSYLISNQNRMERILLKDVLYIMRDGKNAVFYLTVPQSDHRKEYRVRRTLAEVYEELNRDDFIFIDRGCIVNLRHISGIEHSDCILTDGGVLAVASSRLSELKKKLNEFWRDKI